MRNSLILSFLIIFVTLFSCEKKKNVKFPKINGDFINSSFVGSETCKDCHIDEYKKWKGSHHDLAMQIANENSILGDFNTTFIHKGVKSKFYTKNGNFFVNTTDKSGNYQDYKIVYTFGVTPLQQYIVEFPKGEYQCLITAWDSVDNKWFHLQPNLDLVHDEWINWTGRAMSWNTMCSDCHSTDLKKNYDDSSDSFHTTFSEINVGCEACHGPSENHVSFYEKNKDNYKGKTPPSIYMPKDLPSKELVDKCARCHSRRSQLTEYFDYDGNFLDHYNPQLLLDPQYFLDGQILDEDYVYASFAQSKMYENDVSCRDCHDMHSMKLLKDGNDLCMSCHTPDYNSPKHHFHKQNTESSKCINCHMQGRIYMGNDYRRDHSFRVPRPDHTQKYGDIPNACNTCHKDKSPKWAADFVIEKYGEKRADHFSDHFLKGYFEDYNEFKKVVDNYMYPDVARATALNLYTNRNLTKQELDDITIYLKDSSALVRNETVDAFQRFNLVDKSSQIKPLLNDSIRLVRISAARYYTMNNLDEIGDKNYNKAKKEFDIMLDFNSDFASGQHQKALYFQAKGNVEEAIKCYKKSLEIDNRYNRSRMNLALIYYQQGLTKKCEGLYLKVAEQEPEFGYSYYMLGLLYNETGDSKKSMEFLKLATEKQPINLNAFYNYILALQKEERFNKSIEIANKALQLDPSNERIIYVKLLGEINTNDTKSALNTCSILLQIAPNNQNYQQIFANLSQGMR